MRYIEHRILNTFRTILSNKKTLATIPKSDRLYRLVMPKHIDYTNIVSVKRSIHKAHYKLGHTAHAAVKHAILSGMITSIELDPLSKPEFCETCAKAKATHLPFPKESHTCATKYGERVHWDLWRPVSVQSIGSNLYAAARIDDALHEVKLYFQKKKSQTFDSYLRDEAYIETQAGNRIKVCHSDQGGEFLSKEITTHQDTKGTVRELTMHDSALQNGTAE